MYIIGFVMVLQKLKLRETCPYCNQTFTYAFETDLKAEGLSNILIRPHEQCAEFVIFVDPNGRVRGTQTIDTNYTIALNKKELDTFLKLFEDEANTSLFYHIQKLDMDSQLKGGGGVLSSKSVEYHQFLRSEFYKAWIRNFIEKKQEFAFAYFKNIILVTLNLYDTIRFSIGFSLDELGGQNVKDVFEFIKGKAVSLGEKLLS
jgi:hypothetical protein